MDRLLALLRQMAARGVGDAMRPLAVTLTFPRTMDKAAAVSALVRWANLVPCADSDAGAWLVEERGGRRATVHVHGLVVTPWLERTLVKLWCREAQGAAPQLQWIQSIRHAGHPLGHPAMAKDLGQIADYALKGYAGSEIVTSGGPATCWREAVAAVPAATKALDAADGNNNSSARSMPSPKAKRRQAIATKAVARATTCAYCGGNLDDRKRRRDTQYCGNSCRTMATRKRKRARAAS